MKRLIAIAGVICLATASSASGAPKRTVVIEDPVGDAQGLNDQGHGDGSVGDHETPADASSVTDIVKIEMSNDAENLYVMFVAEAAPPATQGTGYRLRANRGAAGGGFCLNFEAFYPGAGNLLDQAVAHLHDFCTGETTQIEVAGPLLTIPRDLHEALGKGKTLTDLQAHGFVYLGTYPAGVPFPVLDTTKIGKDYKLRR